ncbi:hypothetical protein IU433_24215 [Nocardia puris]|uniref:Uncharacterized protein n=1 Tax=Nocardia puris TaxID=208602 RepID=A0A366DH61_9NOCA|nr:hypothetical protein [Nocardia puris]MBF6213240.1 hypothetical protein [Nocardia puris]MBF6369832.1 hypothetical protein [Nocardia puris]MBF6462119.1 hypothetical protein [Nocardia puris]RBO89422.1 hypothetical protein DFR74_107100 [Nocardia puris]
MGIAFVRRIFHSFGARLRALFAAPDEESRARADRAGRPPFGGRRTGAAPRGR